MGVWTKTNPFLKVPTLYLNSFIEGPIINNTLTDIQTMYTSVYCYIDYNSYITQMSMGEKIAKKNDRLDEN